MNLDEINDHILNYHFHSSNYATSKVAPHKFGKIQRRYFLAHGEYFKMLLSFINLRND